MFVNEYMYMHECKHTFLFNHACVYAYTYMRIYHGTHHAHMHPSLPSSGSPSPWLFFVRGPMPHTVFARLLCSYTTSLLSSTPSPNAPGSILGLTGLMLDMLDALPWSRNGEFRSTGAEFLASPLEMLRSPATDEALTSTSSRFCTRVRKRDDDAVARRPCAKRAGGEAAAATTARGMACHM